MDTWHRIPTTVNGSEILPVTSKVIFPYFQGWTKKHTRKNTCIFCHFEWPLNFIEIKIGSGPAHWKVGIYFDQSQRSIFGASKWKSSPNFSATRFVHFLNIQLGVCMIKVQIFILKYLLKSDSKYRSTLFSRLLDYGQWQSGNPCVSHDLSTIIFLSIWVWVFWIKTQDYWCRMWLDGQVGSDGSNFVHFLQRQNLCEEVPNGGRGWRLAMSVMGKLVIL